jgi:predicted dienelactone hydrolase
MATLSYDSLTLGVPGRGLPLDMSVTMPSEGKTLLLIFIAHGYGPSLYLPSKDGYASLADFYVAHGFVVIQPLYLNSKQPFSMRLHPDGPLFSGRALPK